MAADYSNDDGAARRRAPNGEGAGGAGRVPPHNVQAEESLLGAMLLSKDAIAAAVEIVSANDFYRPAHGHIFEAVTSLFGAGEPADPVTVAEELSRAGLLEAIGGPATLVSIQANTPATTSAARYARIIEEHALLRRLIGAAGEIAEIGYGLPDDVAKAVDRAESMVFEVAQRRLTDTLQPIGSLLGANLDRLEQLYERGDHITGVPTGFLDLDEILNGLQPSNLVVIGARPSMGKTSMALGMATHAALEAQRPVLVFSLEMSQLELSQRILCSEARVDSSKVRTGRLAEADWTKISHAVGRLAEAPIFIDDNPNLTVMEIRAKARRLRSKVGDLGLVVVDYIQLMTGRSKAESRQVEVSEISRSLKILARELDTPVVALAQLNRQLETRADKRPMLADLRESGCLTGDTRLLRADTNAEVTLAELALTGERDVPVWSLDRDLRMVTARMTHAFSTGVKPVFELRLASGRSVKASANHPFLTIEGWERLDELAVGSRIAVPRRVPEPPEPSSWPDDDVILLAHLLGDGCFASKQPLHYTSGDPANIDIVEKSAVSFGVNPRRVPQGTWTHLYLSAGKGLARGRRNPIVAWLDGLGLYGLRSHEKFVPNEVFGLSDRQVALFLHHLWATDGSLGIYKLGGGTRARIYYASTSRRLIDDVRLLLSRFGILTRLVTTRKGQHRLGYQLDIVGSVSMRGFLDHIGVHGKRGNLVPTLRERLAGITKDAYCDALPSRVTNVVADHIQHSGLAAVEVFRRAGFRRYKLGRAPIPRWRLDRIASILDDPVLQMLATSDVHWDRVVAIDPLGEQPVFDATVAETHNFVGNGICLENSLEQDSDVVMFIYRDEVYNPETPDRGTAEILVAKHRNGPTGKARLAWLDHYTKFANMARGV